MSLPDPRVYLLDVEGTTSPASLVYQQLFPYARKHLESFLCEQATDPAVLDDLELLATENRAETFPTAPRIEIAADLGQSTAYLNWLMDQDRKSTALKSLQGKIWKSGFLAGELVGTMFPDVPEALARWSAKAKVVIYSSGSVEAQQLLFRFSSAGDLTPFIAAFFDTRIGPKTAPASYRAIAGQVQAAPRSILFISDVLRELDPARDAGCQTRLSLRDGNAPVGNSNEHLPIRSFEEIP
jgi:enolase-phosphatase E1